jgi:hypothetical protein
VALSLSLLEEFILSCALSFIRYSHLNNHLPQALVNTLNMRKGVREQHLQSLNLTDIIDRDLRRLDAARVIQSGSSIISSSDSQLDEHGWFVGLMYDRHPDKIM